MNASKAARNAASITNNTNVYGIMGGSARSVGKISVLGVNCFCNRIPSSPAAGLAFMKENKLLSVNPLSSGGVGRRVTMILNR